MKVRKACHLLILSSLLFLFVLQSLSLVTGKEESFSDPENDVYRFNTSTMAYEKGNYSDNIDIINTAINDQYGNVTFAAEFTGADILCTIYLYTNYDPKNVTHEYGIFAQNLTGLYDVFFIHYIPIGGPFYTIEYWTGAGWSSNVLSATSIGSISSNFIEGTVPLPAWTVPENVTWYVASAAGDILEDAYIYADFAPEEYNPYKKDSKDTILSYDLLIIAGTIIGVSFFILKRLMKKLNKIK